MDSDNEGSDPVEVPVFRPSWEEFKDFNKFIEKVEPRCAAGLCKIVPPPEWVPNKSGYNISAGLYISHPVRQHVKGRGGVYTVLNVVEEDQMTVDKFYKLAEEQEKKRSKREQELASAQTVDYEQLQRAFWSNISFMPPIYGADSVGTLFDDNLEVWNANKLGSILDVLQDEIPGVNNAMLYFGMWKAAFAWHVEDMNLYSVNFLHFGRPKQWYVIPPKYADRMDHVCQGLFPEMHKHCPEFLRHKQCFVHPSVLSGQHGIPVLRMTQHPGEYMITFPRAYHSGFNYGFNCAESVNFASERWIPIGRKASRCVCRPDTVGINMDHFEEMLEEYKAGTLKLQPRSHVVITKPLRSMTGIASHRTTDKDKLKDFSIREDEVNPVRSPKSPVKSPQAASASPSPAKSKGRKRKSTEGSPPQPTNSSAADAGTVATVAVGHSAPAAVVSSWPAPTPDISYWQQMQMQQVYGGVYSIPVMQQQTLVMPQLEMPAYSYAYPMGMQPVQPVLALAIDPAAPAPLQPTTPVPNPAAVFSPIQTTPRIKREPKGKTKMLPLSAVIAQQQQQVADKKLDTTDSTASVKRKRKWDNDAHFDPTNPRFCGFPGCKATEKTGGLFATKTGRMAHYRKVHLGIVDPPAVSQRAKSTQVLKRQKSKKKDKKRKVKDEEPKRAPAPSTPLFLVARRNHHQSVSGMAEDIESQLRTLIERQISRDASYERLPPEEEAFVADTVQRDVTRALLLSKQRALAQLAEEKQAEREYEGLQLDRAQEAEQLEIAAAAAAKDTDSDSKDKSNESDSESEEEFDLESDGMFEVSSILGHRKVKGKDQFKVKWEHYAETWEPIENVQHLLADMYPDWTPSAERKRESKKKSGESKKEKSTSKKTKKEPKETKEPEPATAAPQGRAVPVPHYIPLGRPLASKKVIPKVKGISSSLASPVPASPETAVSVNPGTDAHPTPTVAEDSSTPSPAPPAAGTLDSAGTAAAPVAHLPPPPDFIPAHFVDNSNLNFD